ncbi:hypothetical protein FACS189429_5630 [Bacteroidia bacterium]|nr:hypothetical protein FACS189429_5630 [Bacteroidia bacterium]GHV43291.1 hypothetical protein FACS1894180_1930 [Bacteroidia bacterium]
MKTIEIDFAHIETNDDFYQQLKSKIDLPEYFGNNLDALYDVLTGYIELPTRLHCINFNYRQIETLLNLFTVFDDAENATNGDFRYICSFDTDTDEWDDEIEFL